MLPETIDRLIDNGALTRGAAGLKARPKLAEDKLLGLLNQPPELHLLARGLHLFQSGASATMPSACGFLAALLTKLAFPPANGTVIWLAQGLAGREWGEPSPQGLARFGLPPDRILYVKSSKVADFLWCLEQAVSTKGVAAIVAETPDEAAFGLTETRRIALKSTHTGVPCYLLAPSRNKNKNATNTATRWSITPAPSRTEGTLLGMPAWSLAMDKNRHGPCVSGTAAFNPYTARFINAGAASTEAATPTLAGPVTLPAAEGTIGSAVVHLAKIRREKFEIAKERS
ncbi:MAG: hypothetical protein AAF580_17780 [Pseudomonadota bacterium]